MKTLLLAALMGIFTFAASAADVTGKWMAQVPGRNGNQEITFNLKQSGSDLTGAVVTANGEQQISDGKVEGDNVMFKVSFEARGNQITQNYKGTVAGNEIKFTREGGGRGGPIEFTAKKQ